MKAQCSSLAPVAAIALCVLGGCVAETVIPAPPPDPVLDTNVYFYPPAGRSVSPMQQDRDKFECNSWAVQQTGFDPSLPHMPPHTRMQVVASEPPPGTAVAGGALTGAVVGSAVSNPWHAGRGALLGAVAGAAVGGIVDAERGAQSSRLQALADSKANGARVAALEQPASQFRRALSACLEARNYSVQ